MNNTINSSDRGRSNQSDWLKRCPTCLKVRIPKTEDTCATCSNKGRRVTGLDNQSEQSAKNAHYPEPDYTHPDEMPIVEQRQNPHSDLRGTIVHFTSEMLDNPNNCGIYPTTNFYNDLEEAILDWHNEQIAMPILAHSSKPLKNST